MKAVIYHTNSKNRRSENVAFQMDGDRFEIKVVKPYKSVFMQMFMYGYKTTFKKRVEYHNVDINLDAYDEVVLISPVWAGKVNAVMRTFLLDHPIKNKKLTLVGCSDGGNKKYFESFEGLLDDSNEIVDQISYVSGVRQN